MKTRVLVTGGTGFVGRHVAASLRDAGFDVVAAGRADADLLDEDAALRLIRGAKPHALVHLAWNVEHGAYWRSPENAAWAKATGFLARCFGEAGGRRFVGVGTCAEYDWTTEDPALAPGRTPLKPATPYGEAKNAARESVEEAARAAGFGAAWARLFHLYGPGEHPSRFVPSLAAALTEGRRAPTGDGARVRDFLRVEDAGRAVALLAASDVRGAVNVGSGGPVTLEHVARTLARLAGREDLLAIGERPSSADEPRRLVPDVAGLRSLGFVPRWTLEDGLKDVLERLKAGATGRS